MKLFISPHAASEGASLLAEKLNATKIKSENSNYRWKNDHLVVNWGKASRAPWFVDGIRILNSPDNVSNAVDKVKTLTILRQNNVSVPEFTTNIEDAKTWIRNGGTVFCRTKTRASGGEGIVIAKNENELVNSPLWTLYKKKKMEFRVAVVDGVVIDFMAKKKRTDWNVEAKGEINQLVRSWDNGWVFCRENVNPPQMVLDLAIKSVQSLGLDFGSVDIIFNESENKAYVLEVNTAPGLEEGGTSLERYSNAFKALVNGQAIPVARSNAPAVPAVAPVAAAPAPRVAPAPIPAAQPREQVAPNVPAAGNVNINDYDFGPAVSQVSIKVVGNTIRVSGNVQGIGKIRLMEITNGRITFFFREQD